MNIYRHEFKRKCPIDGELISYKLEIFASTVILAEEIVEAIKNIGPNLHEEIAEQLHFRFGGKQRLVAKHGSVEIETIRP